MNGAESLVETLGHNGVEVCFANPGTSEMHFVAALDRQPRVRGVLGLFEGIVTGAADGYSRLLDRPAATLLHLGPGAANGLSALHNALRARSSIVNIVGDHAGYHRGLDAPLTSDIEGGAAAFQRLGAHFSFGELDRRRRRRRHRLQSAGTDQLTHPSRRYGMEFRR